MLAGTLFSLFIEILAACHCCLLCKGVTTKEWYDLCPESPCDDGTPSPILPTSILDAPIICMGHPSWMY